MSGISAISPISNVIMTAVSPVRRVSSEAGSNSTALIDKTKKTECQTCKNRKYSDVSNENNVSFKSPAHISPKQSASVVRSHEHEHVANAFAKDAKADAKLVSASVRLTTSVCPECGSVYVSGGVTSTTMKYSSTPYDAAKKAFDATLLVGSNFDMSA